MDCVAEKIAIATRADQGGTAAIGKEATENDRENEQAIMPKRADIIFGDRFSNNASAIVDFVTQGPPQPFQEIKSKRDQPSRFPAFDLQDFLRAPPRRTVWSAQR